MQEVLRVLFKLPDRRRSRNKTLTKQWFSEKNERERREREVCVCVRVNASTRSDCARLQNSARDGRSLAKKNQVAKQWKTCAATINHPFTEQTPQLSEHTETKLETRQSPRTFA